MGNRFNMGVDTMTYLYGNIVYDKLHILDDGRIMMEKNGKGEIMTDADLPDLVLCTDLSQESCYTIIRLLEKLLDNYKTNKNRL